MDKASIVLVTLVLYQSLLIAVGYWASKRVTTEEDYFLGGRQLGPIVAALSYSASSSSAWSLLGMSGAAYMLGLSSIWIAAGSILGAVIAWIYVAPRMVKFAHENNTVTIGDFLGHNVESIWQKRIVKASAIVILISFAFYVAAQFQGAGNTFSSTFDISLDSAIVLGAVIIMVYTFLGGFWAVSVTDAIQGALMVMASIALPLFALIKIGGFGPLFEGLGELGRPELLELTGENIGLAAIGFALGSLAIGLGPIGQPHLLVRFMALRDEKAMRQARALTLSWFIIVFIGMFIVGLTANVLIPNPEFGAEAILFQLTGIIFTPIIGAIILAAVLSAIMSTADSQLLVGASSISYDLKFGQRYKGKEVLVSRLAVAFLVVMSILISLYLPATIFDRALFAWNALGAAFGPTVVMKLAGYRFTGKTIYTALLTGFITAVAISLFPDTPGDVIERSIPFVLGFGILYFGREKD
ncbi:sodium/proline symporter [Pseudemcibacter aquimaris]|uniref:sodium/proline symporter n=1 Tax=Pseudemcibacter aquimaris TaxID=2857064 RepID=UPI002012517F|nr:sodium/proline symporter [Pseudemcibacter aquimaris]MCC3861202.1 sodium/proline symporter [Pseudemcibacter aquimaris]WDU57977.1 sodium/proline symporter [Pseudemcibacter aquimaris]